MKPKRPKGVGTRGPIASGKKLEGRITAVCSVEEQMAANEMAKSEDLTVAKWARKVLVAAMQERLKK
jgi:hypothetical protein